MAIFDNLFGAPPEYLTGLLQPEQTEKLRKQALTTGLVNSAIALIAQPRNQRYGSALPYIGKALMAGQQAGQNVYANALQGLETQQKLAELKRQQEQRKAYDEGLKNLYTTIPAVTESVPGGYAPAQQQVMEGQVAPNFGMARLPDVTREIAPAKRELNTQALIDLAATGDPRAANLISSIKTAREISAAPKVDLVKLGRGEVAYDPASGKYVAQGLPEQQKPKDYGNEIEAQSTADFGKSFGELLPAQQQSILNKVDAKVKSRAPQVSVNLSDPTAKAKVALDLSERSEKFFKDDIETANQYNLIKNLAQNPTPTGDTTLLYSLFKVLDPTSTVREGEVNMVIQSRSIPNQLKGYAQKLAGGGSLLPKERQEILKIAEQRVNVRKANVEKNRKAFIDNAKRFDLDPDVYVPNPYAGTTETVEVDY